MKIKSIYILFFLGCSLASTAQSFDYLQAAQTYWKYRYRLVGDFIQLKGELDELKTAKK